MRILSRPMIIIMSVSLLLTAPIARSQPKRYSDPLEKYRDPHRYNKSETKAFLFSNLGIFVPLTAGMLWWGTSDKQNGLDFAGPATLGLSGILIGPSLGYYYGGCWKRGISGIMVRAATGAAMVGSVVIMGRAGLFRDSAMPGVMTIMIGPGILFIEALYDASKVKEVVKEKNRRRSERARTITAISPVYFADSRAAGIQLEVSF